MALSRQPQTTVDSSLTTIDHRLTTSSHFFLRPAFLERLARAAFREPFLATFFALFFARFAFFAAFRGARLVPADLRADDFLARAPPLGLPAG